MQAIRENELVFGTGPAGTEPRTRSRATPSTPVLIEYSLSERGRELAVVRKDTSLTLTVGMAVAEAHERRLQGREVVRVDAGADLVLVYPATVNVADEDQDQDSLLWLYRNLIHYRALHPALSSGTWLPVTSDVPADVASLRSSPTETALVLTNVSSAPVTPTLSIATGPLCGSPRVTSVSGAEESIVPPIVNAMGGFGGYRPVPVLDAHVTAVITFAR